MATPRRKHRAGNLNDGDYCILLFGHNWFGGVHLVDDDGRPNVEACRIAWRDPMVREEVQRRLDADYGNFATSWAAERFDGVTPRWRDGAEARRRGV